MPAQILEFPSIPNSAVGFRSTLTLHRPALKPRLRVADMVHLLALHDVTRRTALETLRRLHAHDGLPLPLNPRVWNGHRLTDARAICASSVWDGAAVEAWLYRPDPGMPPHGVNPRHLPGSLTPSLPPFDLHAEMARRASNLVGAGA